MLKIAGKLPTSSTSIDKAVLTENISHFSIQYKQDDIEFEITDSCVCMIFNYGSPFDVHVAGNIKKIGSKQFNIVKLNKDKLHIILNDNEQNISLHAITMSLNYFNYMIDYFSIKLTDNINEVGFIFADSGKITDEIHYNIQTVHTKKKSTLTEGNVAYVHGKLLTILALQIEERNGYKAKRKKDTPTVQAKMYRIEKLISNDWTNSYSLKYLSKLIGTNECYLKRDFKVAFGMPVNTYRMKKKMEQANNLLLHSNESIKSISKLLGYKHTTHFTSAYKKYYNTTPGELRKNFDI